MPSVLPKVEEGGGSHGYVRLWMVDEIVEFSAELKFRRFGNLSIFEKGDVQLGEPWAVDCVAPDVAECSRRWDGKRPG